MGSLSLLQWIFLTQGSNWSLLHCKWIPYQLSYQRSSKIKIGTEISFNHAETLLPGYWDKKTSMCCLFNIEFLGSKNIYNTFYNISIQCINSL